MDGSEGSAAAPGPAATRVATGSHPRGARGAHFALHRVPWYRSNWAVAFLTVVAIADLGAIAVHVVPRSSGHDASSLPTTTSPGSAGGATSTIVDAPRSSSGQARSGETTTTSAGRGATGRTTTPSTSDPRPSPRPRGSAGAGTKTSAGGNGASGTPLDPTLFATGACVAFTPTHGDRHQTVFVDAGHGGIDPGATGETSTGLTIYEADETLPVELDVATLLRAQGFRVVVSRTGNDTVLRPILGDITQTTGIFTAQGAKLDIAARDDCANLAKASLLVGVYFDAATSSTAGGCITAYDATRPFAAQNLEFANLLQKDVVTQLESRDVSVPTDGVQSDTLLGGPPLTATAGAYDHLLLLGPADPGFFTTPSDMPGAIVEPLFITDPSEGSVAASTWGRQAIAVGIAHAVEQFLEHPN